MRLSSLADYAIVMMHAAASRTGGDHANGGTVTADSRISATQLAEETGIPLPTAQKLVSMLSRAGLLTSVRGSGGGIVLARAADSISVAEIVEAVEGPIAMTSCVSDGGRDCALEGSCLVQPHWPAVNAAVRSALEGVSLASLHDAARRKVSGSLI